ncbi:MAG: hypothetical protein NT018_11525 [Armatimonadetes bacterium]|nr:hypothetical protein [Armatimonadota bacterium]
MNITRIERHSSEELIANMRKVRMLTHPDAIPYLNSEIELPVIHTDEIAPAQRYVLNKEIMKVRDLKWALQEHGIDLFKLDGYVSIWLEGYDDPIDVLPPVIEESKEADGTTVKILNDGMHRVYLARMERTPIQVVYVSNVPSEFPYYAFPLVNGWNDVEIVQDLPEGYIKKWHRIKNYKSLYRDFNTGFQNVGGPRGHFSNAGK